MIDNEEYIFDKCATKLREEFNPIYVVGAKVINAPTTYPAVSIIARSNTVAERYSSFEQVENVAEITFEIEVVSNLVKGKEKQCKDIIKCIDEVFNEMHYIRKFNEPIDGNDNTLARRIARYRKLIGG